jgi:putative DNA primase/helicase
MPAAAISAAVREGLLRSAVAAITLELDGDPGAIPAWRTSALEEWGVDEVDQILSAARAVSERAAMELKLAPRPTRRRDESSQRAPRVVSVRELLELAIPVREYLLEPIFRLKETAMIHAWRGVGKTYFGLELAFAIASGGTFLGWKAPKPRSVLYIDGEMPAKTMQDRLAAIVAASDCGDAFDPALLQLYCSDLQELPLRSLSTDEGQEIIEPFVERADLVVVDSLSTLARHGRAAENETESWLPMQSWALDLRRRGKSVTFLHHDGKGGAQRGASSKEDILDLVIHLRRPADYSPVEGARFEVHFVKNRGLCGSEVEPFEARLKVEDGRAKWTRRKLEDAQLARVAALLEDGCKKEDIAQELGVSRATVFRLAKKARELGMLEAE